MTDLGINVIDINCGAVCVRVRVCTAGAHPELSDPGPERSKAASTGLYLLQICDLSGS